MSDAQTVVVLGGRTGMLGQALCVSLAAAGHVVVPQARADVDVTDSTALADYLARQKPDAVVNAVAYTAVDQAEDEPEAAELLNRRLPCALGRIALEQRFHLLHISTDFVFDGRGTAPYKVTDETNPLSVYGSTKLAGEKSLLAHQAENIVVARTAWLFGPGRANFVSKMLSLAMERDELQVVHDQIGSPTYTMDLARMCADLLGHKASGLYHLVNGGTASWCELAAEAVALAGLNCRIHAIPTSAWPTRAVRPAFSVLDTSRYTELTGSVPRPWAQALRDYVYQDYCVDGRCG